MPMDWEDLVTQIDAQLPKEVWAQTLIGIGVLVLTALFVQWVVARVVLLLAHRLLVLTGHDDWDKALQRRRAYQNLWYAVPLPWCRWASTWCRTWTAPPRLSAGWRMPGPGSACSWPCPAC